MATTELRLSNKVQKETGMSEVMICLRYSVEDPNAKNGHRGIDLSSGSGIFVKPSYFEYYINRKKTPKTPIPLNKNTATMEKAASNGWALRKRGEIVINKKKALPPEEVTYHSEQAVKVDELKKAIIDAFNDEDNKDGLTSAWLKDVVDMFHFPGKQKADNPIKKSFFELAEEYITRPHGKKGRVLGKSLARSYRVLLRAAARYEGFVKAKDKSRKRWSWNIDKVSKDDIEDFFCYVAQEKELSETYPDLYKKLFASYPPSVKPGRGKLGGRGENTIISDKRRLKALFNHFYNSGYTKNRPFDGLIVGTETYNTPIYITIDERNQIADVNLRAGWEKLSAEDRQNARASIETVEQQRDIFIFQCFVGCRVSDLIRLTEMNVNDGMLIYTPQKTEGSSARQARVPLHPRALALIDKYRGIDTKGRLFPVITAQRYNDTLKVIFKLAGITRHVEVRNPKTGKNEMVPINTIASSHMARRTFIGNAYFKVQDPNLIGKMSGHVEGSTAFSRYRKIEDETLKNVIDLIG